MTAIISKLTLDYGNWGVFRGGILSGHVPAAVGTAPIYGAYYVLCTTRAEK